jgi:hypothetical protein
VELSAVTSRQNAGQNLAQVFPRFANLPRAKTRSEPKPELLSKQADIYFWRCRMEAGVACRWQAGAQ